MACGGGGDDPTATSPAPTDTPPTVIAPEPTDVPPTDVPPTDVPPTDVPPTDVSHRLMSHRLTSHRLTSHRLTHRLMSHRLMSHRRTSPPTDTPPPTPTTVVIPEDTQLLVAISSPPLETNLPWAMTESDLIQLRPMFEYLVDIDNITGDPAPMLATEWDSSDGDTRWEFSLESGVEFHFEIGEFTASDVIHSVDMLSQSSLQEDAAFWQDTLDTAEEVDSQTVAFNFNRAVDEDELIHFVSPEGSLAITSEAQFDDVGEAGLELEPAGTGPWQYISRENGEAIFYESVDDHWRKTPEFDKLEIRWEENEATRFASVVFGRYQITDLPEGLQITAAERGARLISGSVLIDRCGRYRPQHGPRLCLPRQHFGGIYPPRICRGGRC